MCGTPLLSMRAPLDRQANFSLFSVERPFYHAQLYSWIRLVVSKQEIRPKLIGCFLSNPVFRQPVFHHELPEACKYGTWDLSSCE